MMTFKNTFSDTFINPHNQKLYFETNYDINYKLTADDLLLVFNYGLVCNTAYWAPQLAYFDALGFKILIHDYRGHFKSEGVEAISEITFVNLASDSLLLIKNLGHSRNIFIGHSMGVNVTLEFARLFPDEVLAQILISGTVLPPQNVMFNSNIFDLVFPYICLLHEKMPDFYRYVWKNIHKNTLVQKIVHHGGFNTSTVGIDFVRHYLQKVAELSPEIFEHLIIQMQKHNIINDLQNILTPSLIISGCDDKIIPNYCQSILKNNLKNSEIYFVNGGGHVPQIAFPTQVNERIEYFVRKYGKITRNHSRQ